MLTLCVGFYSQLGCAVFGDTSETDESLSPRFLLSSLDCCDNKMSINEKPIFMYLKFLSRIAVIVFLSIALSSCWGFYDNDYDDDTPVDYTLGKYHPAKKIHQIVRYNDYPSDVYERQAWTWNGDDLQRISFYRYNYGYNSTPERTDYEFTYNSCGRISSVVENMYGTDNTVCGTRTHTFTYYANKVKYYINGGEQYYYHFGTDGKVQQGNGSYTSVCYDGSEFSFSPVYNPIKNLLPEFNFLDYSYYSSQYALCFSDNMIVGYGSNISYIFGASDDNYPTSISSDNRLLYQISYY